MVLNIEDGIWYLETTKDKVPNKSKFKFVINNIFWQQPGYYSDRIPKDYLTDDGYGGYSLFVRY
jgi:hypothetical protein